ncbi:type III secretion system export apparatus subunit SctR [Thalassospira sp.]|uniref:type III secretion system export apparatus subunit SctR n=1 Tax=Thalassospira sp. TaxID=1912094 RepID=UPI000C43A7B6|nr:type III secretion system export apparatus subunit SctR [Thalassospira sp.]MBC05410.1 EscR/YscR/HrcR family type III secretion system export apparatus protein [Thalassospira sp.]|tara:strand:- start:10697 stop:11350 length:654 start_codon:yes stop_codon:yes gene_type:complete
MINIPDPLTLALLLALLALIPFVIVITTSFVKIAVVLSLVRNALGVQQIPPNMALYGLALILTVYIMAPVGASVFDILQEGNVSFNDTANLFDVLAQAFEPFRYFLMQHTDETQREFFVQTIAQIWPADLAAQLGPDSFLVLAPAFTVAELTSAFEVGFLLYLPFVVIDLIVSNILLAMGMMMVSPMTISLPLKLFLFVMVDGWSRLIHGLVLSYVN